MIVIKIGGAEGIDYDLVADDIAHFASKKYPYAGYPWRICSH